MKNNKVLRQIEIVEKYVKETIEGFFPMEIVEVVDAKTSEDNENTMEGVVAEKSGRNYYFVIDKETGIPLLQPLI